MRAHESGFIIANRGRKLNNDGPNMDASRDTSVSEDLADLHLTQLVTGGIPPG